ncbi:peptidase domain-containing ABC transporter [Vibrio scophthalmi]|uniref:Toxin secretion ABC transporter, transmembrane region n=1 Tax=Vibrio scophthalmi LMG 19158 TaxID=870967 RepID=F9RI70_9VIBR|nr:cysteine peptidase family C39 domain-containing protein [Vibrio scophthalmi]EGU42790.1 Toxin secretion ABC transporter, transmembrane region [Vibrio scophthalmi LMG 19158]
MKNKLSIVLQDEISECGLACISMLCSYYNKPLSIYSLRRQYLVGVEGLSFYEMESILFNNGMPSCGYNLEPEHLSELDLPAILQWRNNHFVVLSKVTDSYIEIHDPAAGKKTYKREMVRNLFSGYALEVYAPSLEKVQGVVQESESKHVKLFDFVKQIPGIYSMFLYLLTSLFLVQIFSLLTPKMLSLVVDEVVNKNDENLFYFIALSFLVLYLLDFINKTIGNELKEKVSIKISKQVSQKLVSILISQSVSYFEKRNFQDLIQRVSLSLNYGMTIVENHIQLCIHILFSFIFSSMLLYLDPGIASVAIVSCLLLVLLRIPFIKNVQALRSDVIEQEISRNQEISSYSNAIKTHKINQTGFISQDKILKLNNRQISLNSKLNKFNQTGLSVFSLVNNTCTIALCYLFVTKVASGDLTVGALFVIYFYKEFLLNNTSRCVELLIDLKKSKPDWLMVESLINSSPEIITESTVFSLEKIDKVKLVDVELRYSSFSNPALENVNVEINNNDFIGVIGRSGSGKSSLIKLLSSLVEPTSGTLLVNNVPVTKFGIKQYRKAVAMYSPDDTIYNATVLQNIVLSESELSYDKVQNILHDVGLLEEVNSLSNGYNTLLGEGGVLLSSGQKQRLCLARALYKDAQILIVDEPTANLDLELKNKILDVMKNHRGIVIVATHDESLLQSCTKIIKINNGLIEYVR